MLADYRRSLKMPEAEEYPDILFFRPLGYLFVRLVYRTRLTPNQVTLLSIAAGLIAGYDFSYGTPAAYVGAGVWYALANILDCADGQLARLQQSGTPLGRIIDGIGDYLTSTAIFLGIGFGYAGGRLLPWILVVAAGISSILHAIVFDHYQGEYLAAGKSSRGSKQDEIGRYQSEIKSLTESGTARIRILILRLYLFYLLLQIRGAGWNGSPADPSNYRETHRRMIRFFSVLGPSTNRSLLILCAFAGRLGVFLWAVVVPLNIWLIVVLMLQRSADKRLAFLPVGRDE